MTKQEEYELKEVTYICEKNGMLSRLTNIGLNSTPSTTYSLYGYDTAINKYINIGVTYEPAANESIIEQAMSIDTIDTSKLIVIKYDSVINSYSVDWKNHNISDIYLNELYGDAFNYTKKAIVIFSIQLPVTIKIEQEAIDFIIKGIESMNININLLITNIDDDENRLDELINNSFSSRMTGGYVIAILGTYDISNNVLSRMPKEYADKIITMVETLDKNTEYNI